MPLVLALDPALRPSAGINARHCQNGAASSRRCAPGARRVLSSVVGPARVFPRSLSLATLGSDVRVVREGTGSVWCRGTFRELAKSAGCRGRCGRKAATSRHTPPLLPAERRRNGLQPRRALGQPRPAPPARPRAAACSAAEQWTDSSSPQPRGPLRAVKKITCIGAGYVGGPTMAMIAYKCPHIEVRCCQESSPCNEGTGRGSRQARRLTRRVPPRPPRSLSSTSASRASVRTHARHPPGHGSALPSRAVSRSHARALAHLLFLCTRRRLEQQGAPHLRAAPRRGRPGLPRCALQGTFPAGPPCRARCSE